jgi:hypothetical protein
MEGDVLSWNPVYLGFRLGYQGKYSQGPLFYPGAYPGVLYQPSYILPRMMIMTAVVMMFMMMVILLAVMFMALMIFVIFMMLIMMIVIMRGSIIIVGNMAGLTFQFDNRMGSGYTASVFPDKFQGPALKTQFGQLSPQCVRINSQVHKCSQSHIPRNTGKTIKM